MLIFIAGASGYIGRQLLPRLLAAGHQVRCLVRRPADADLLPPGVQACLGDVLHKETLPSALAGVDCAFYLVHSMAAGEKGFADRDREAARNFATAARAAGVRRVVYLGGLGSGSMSPHLQSRQETGRILAEFGPPVVEFRAGIIVGAGSASFEIIRSLAERLPFMICPRWVTTRVQPIWIEDVLAYLASAVSAGPDVDNQIFDIGGAFIETYQTMLSKYSRIRGLKRLLLRVPVLTPRLSSYWLDLVTPVPHSITRPLVEGLRTEVVCRNQAARLAFPRISPRSYLEALAYTLDRDDPGTLSDAFDQKGVRRASHVQNGILSYCCADEVNAPTGEVRDFLHTLGGGRGWLYTDWLWRLRGWLDSAMGGVGMRRSRVRVIPLHAGDKMDFWRVQDATADRLLLRAEMKVPGKAWLQFLFQPSSTGTTRLRMIASFEPLGLLGELYWWALYPLHMIIFKGMMRRIRKGVEHATSTSRHLPDASPRHLSFKH
jgi:uncharacterized protein YbjT (DUF2867 family)